MYQKELSEYERQPTPEEIRERIENISKKKVRLAHKWQYITGTRVSEVCGKWAIRLGDVNTAVFLDRINNIRYPAIIFQQRSAKIQGEPRHIAIPLNPKFEPWIEELANYIQSRKDRGPLGSRIFRIAPRTINHHSHKAFQGLHLWIEKYKEQPGHWKPFSNHGLRHIRNSNLESYYAFDGLDLIIFFGWSITRDPTMPRMAKRYGNFYRRWARYFPKLCRPYGQKAFEILEQGVYQD